MPRVLLADDDFTMVALLKTLLRMEGFETGSLMDKKGDILENIRLEKPDILLIDFYLGDRSGVDIVRQVRESSDLKDIRIIMVSGIDKSQECLAAGANDFLLKPYMPEELFSKLRAEG
jgi:DNA-binding response OmpR family regulator